MDFLAQPQLFAALLHVDSCGCVSRQHPVTDVHLLILNVIVEASRFHVASISRHLGNCSIKELIEAVHVSWIRFFSP